MSTDQPPTATAARGRFLRSLTGADESILAGVPTERPKYTALGGVVLGTAITAMFSMSVALYFVFGRFQPAVFAFVPAWGFFILFLDRWLMSSASEPRSGRRLVRLLPRFALAVMFGVVIAEPLLLGMFNTAIEQRIRDDRLAEVNQRESDLRMCNPVPGTKEAESGITREKRCEGLLLNVTTDAESKQRELDEARGNADKLKAKIDADAAAYADLERKAREECNGTKGTEYSGIPGQGPNCRRLREQADRYRKDHRIDEDNAEYARLSATVNRLTTEAADRRAAAAGRIDSEINEAVRTFRENQREDMGLLERLRTLGDLSDEHAHVRLSGWALRIFFIAVDCLPVLLKFLGGHGVYDRVVADQLKRQERSERVVNESRRRDVVRQQALARFVGDVEHSAARRKAEFDARVRHVDVEVLRESLVDERAARLLGDSPTVTITGLPRDGGPA